MYPRQPPHEGYPPQQGGYPPPQGGYPPSQGGYPPSQGGYPPPHGGYPPQQGGYPPPPGDYPPQHGGYPPPQGGYPPPQGGYPPPQGGYPPPSSDFGWKPQEYPPSQGGYPPPHGGYPPPHGGYPPQHGGYPPSQGGYPPSQGGYPPPPGDYPPQHGGYPPSQGGYPPPPGDYPPQQGGYPPPQGDYPAHDNPSLYPYLPSSNVPSSSQSYSGGYAGSSHQVAYQGTVTEYQPFNPNDDAAKLYKAMKGFGTNEAAIIDVLCNRTSKQRQEIILAYKTGYGKDLLQNLKSECSGKFEDLLVALLKTPEILQAEHLKKAIDGMGTDESSLIDILCTKSNQEMIELKQAYKYLFKTDLEKAVGGDVSGYFKRFLVSLSAGFRSDAPPDPAKAAAQARELYEAGAKKLGTDEVKFNRIFAVESFPHLKLVFDEYRKQTGKDIESAIKSEMSGYVEEAFLCVVSMARNPPQYFAKRMADTMRGAGTQDKALIRNMVLRSEIDMVQIKQEYQRKYGKNLESAIKSDCSGDYKRGLLCLAGDSGWR